MIFILMTKTDRALLMGLSATSIIAYIYLLNKKKSGNPVKVLGLDENHSLKFTLGMAIITTSVLGYNLLMKKPTTI